MENEVLIGSDGDLARLLGLLLGWVNDLVLVIFEDSKESVEADINAGRLDHRLVEGLDLDPASLNFRADIAIREQHGWRPYPRLSRLRKRYTRA